MINVGAETYNAWVKNFGKDHASYIESIPSTQDQAKKLLSFSNSQSINQHLVVSEEQTKGKGRGMNTWSSPKKNESLQCSAIYKLNHAPQPITTPLFGWAMFKSLCDAFGGDNFSIKAPNDIYISEKKVSGLLLDTVSQGDLYHLIFGIGLNVFSTPKSVDHSTSLHEEGIEVNLDNWSHFIHTLQKNLEIVTQDSVESELKSDKINDLTFALKAYFDNNIEKMNSNGDIVLTDQRKISWRHL